MRFAVFTILLYTTVFLRSHASASSADLAACSTDADCQNGGTCGIPISEIYNSTEVQHCNDGKLSCYFGGTCLKPWTNNNPGKDWKCECPEGRSGNECEYDDSAMVECQCAPEYRGTHCAFECPCENGGTCAKSADGDVCACPDGYIGDTCEIAVNYCNNNGKLKCLYGGTCLKPWTNDNKGPSWMCECPASRSGPECEVEASATDNSGTSSSDGTSSSTTGDSVPTSSDTSGGGKGGLVFAILVILGLVFFVVGYLRIHKQKGRDPKTMDTAATNNSTNNIMPYSDGSGYADNAANDTVFPETTPPSPVLLNVDIDSTNRRAKNEIV